MPEAIREKCSACDIVGPFCEGQSNPRLCYLKTVDPFYRGQLRVLAKELDRAEVVEAYRTIGNCPYRDPVEPCNCLGGDAFCAMDNTIKSEADCGNCLKVLG